MTFLGMGGLLVATVLYALDLLGVTPGSAGLANLMLVAGLILGASGLWMSSHAHRLQHRQGH